ncbi:hypothetical protein HZC00_02770 [Candidatus Kaiserbacteria bacterium]|nr:hypothetical protein [Candidatus Kaiserbacteria bacterium]
MDDNTTDMLEIVNFIKDNMVTKSDHDELVARVDRMEKKMDDGFSGLKSRVGGLENRIDNESARTTDLENRVRVVLPSLPAAPERV